ncbi:hypothetical protein ACEWY4_009976 [Coilia grayii]|uniref:Uncharacterized protein n=1 Tax=Coilia grayii TaxID=363190 RepID=A0ABD1K7Y4_9TELE
MESQGCGVMNALRAAFATIRRRISKRRVRQRQKNYRISQMQAMERMEQERDKGLNKTLQKPKAEVAKPGLKTSARGCSRAQLEASGWRPRGQEGEARSVVEERMPAAIRASQEARLTKRVKITTVLRHDHAGCLNV